MTCSRDNTPKAMEIEIAYWKERAASAERARDILYSQRDQYLGVTVNQRMWISTLEHSLKQFRVDQADYQILRWLFDKGILHGAISHF